MEVEYSLSIDEYIVFNTMMKKRIAKRPNLISLVPIALLIYLLIIVTAAFAYKSYREGGSTGNWIVPAILMLIVFVLIFRKKINKLFGERLIRISQILLIGLFATCFVTSCLIRVVNKPIIAAITSVFIVASVILLFSRLNKWLLVSHATNSKVLLPHKIHIDSDGVSRKGESGESQWKWEGIVEVSRDGVSIYLFISQVAAFIIPRRAFNNPAQAEEFYDLAQSYWQSAHQGS